jgi:hypothetical protein
MKVSIDLSARSGIALKAIYECQPCTRCNSIDADQHSAPESKVLLFDPGIGCGDEASGVTTAVTIDNPAFMLRWKGDYEYCVIKVASIVVSNSLERLRFILLQQPRVNADLFFL